MCPLKRHRNSDPPRNRELLQHPAPLPTKRNQELQGRLTAHVQQEIDEPETPDHISKEGGIPVAPGLGGRSEEPPTGQRPENINFVRGKKKKSCELKHIK